MTVNWLMVKMNLRKEGQTENKHNITALNPITSIIIFKVNVLTLEFKIRDYHVV